MARLDQQKRRDWKVALSSTKSAWVVCGFDSNEASMSARLEGMPGLIDWALHGQVSGLLKREGEIGDCCLIPGDPLLLRPSFLFFSTRTPSGAQSLLDKARKLGLSELTIAESTFPEDFLSKLKQTLKKEGIRYTKLEPES